MPAENINVKDGVGAVVVKGGAKMAPEERVKAISDSKNIGESPEPVKIEEDIYLVDDMYKFLRGVAERNNLPFGKLISDMIVDAAHMHIYKGCPHCLPQKIKEQKKLRREFELRKKLAEKKRSRNKSKRKSAKEARKRNR